MRRNPGRNSQGSGAQELRNFVKDFTEEKGRFPKMRELPVKKVTVVYHFGSYEALLQVARMGEKELPLRKGKKKRYCRFCEKLLPRHRWFFCIFLTDSNGVSCEDRYAERESVEGCEEIKRNTTKSRRKMWHKCKDCGEKCKVYLPKSRTEPNCVFICRADPEYEEMNEKFSPSLQKA
jgi:hypothetical protein